jgi:hypothetical protein
MAETMRKTAMASTNRDGGDHAASEDEPIDINRGSLNSIRCDAKHVKRLIADTVAASRVQAQRGGGPQAVVAEAGKKRAPIKEAIAWPPTRASFDQLC